LSQGERAAAVITGNTRVDRLLSEMSLDEKISLLHGLDEPSDTSQGEAGYVPGIPRLRIPALRLADGPPGILTRVPSTAPPSTMALAATFSRTDARSIGKLIGREARSHGVDIALQPFINLDRDITWERGYNTFGEDPFLTGQIGAEEIRGIQSEGVMAQAKHFIAYETNSTDVIVDDQTLHEVYMAPFAAASAAGVASIMCSYNKINGQYACGNGALLQGVLRRQIGFQGFVTSDWGATHDASFLSAGLDMEMPGPLKFPTTGPSYFEADFPKQAYPLKHDAADKDELMTGLPEEPKSPLWKYPDVPQPTSFLKANVLSGVTTEEEVTRTAGRILIQMEKFGWLDGKSKHTVAPSSIEENAEASERVAEDGAVLLKNDGNALPLRKSDLQSLALIGPGASQVVAVGRTGEKAVGLPEREVGALQALKEIAVSPTSLNFRYAPANDMDGVPIPATVLSHDHRPGLQRMVNAKDAADNDGTLDFTLRRGNALSAGISYSWQGTLNVSSPGNYRLHLQILGCFATLRIDDKKVAETGRMWLHGDVTQPGQDNIFPTTDGLDNLRVVQALAAGSHTISVSTTPDGSNNPVQIRLNWVTPSEQDENYRAAITAAKESSTAIVFVWSRNQPVFALPGDQDKLIEDVAAVNANTIVVLNTSQPVAMPWLGSVKAVLQMWWPGDEGGWATAKLLSGKTSPGGRLPFSWPRRLEDSAANDPAHPERSGGGVNGKTTFSEGVLIGYRWFDERKIAPQFPFGYGLSYTHFSYSGLKTATTADGGLDVSFSTANTGSVTGDEVAQVYIGAPEARPTGVAFAPRVLAGFERIHLAPGESRTTSIHVPLRTLQYWSVAGRSWVTPKSIRIVSVGSSSRDSRLQSAVAF
jgi:beta-glucosidase